MWPIEQDKSHQAVLPVFEKTPPLPNLKDIIRAMFTHAYRESIALFNAKELVSYKFLRLVHQQ